LSGFVSNRKLTALSQYERGVFFEELVSQKTAIEKQIIHFFENVVKDNISLSSYVIDLCLVDGKGITHFVTLFNNITFLFLFLFFFEIDTERKFEIVMIIDLNPFHANTDGCLFSWEKDHELIHNGTFDS
jgi:hypothetical protein